MDGYSLAMLLVAVIFVVVVASAIRITTRDEPVPRRGGSTAADAASLTFNVIVEAILKNLIH